VSIQIPGETHKPSYFLISVSTRENLELCLKYALAGFPSSAGGAWTFCEIRDGEFVSFLHGARAYNLYQVVRREAIKDADSLPPWRALTSKVSGKTYSFPFRVELKPVRAFNETLVRAEFSYVAENLLLRGGYRKTHFQADQTTLQSASQMGTLFEASVQRLSLPDHVTFNPSFTRNAKLLRSPEVSRFQETILQSAIRCHLQSEANLDGLLTRLNLEAPAAESLEILGEKALTQGYIDLLLKQRVPLGSVLMVPIEVKLGRAGPRDVAQLRDYMDELAGDCPSGVLVASEFGRGVAPKARNLGIKLLKYALRVDLKRTATFEEICEGLVLEVLDT
jgi:hypothetical protein